MDHPEDNSSSQQKKETEDELKHVRGLDHEHWITETDVLKKIVDKFAELDPNYRGDLQELMNKFHQRKGSRSSTDPKDKTLTVNGCDEV